MSTRNGWHGKPPPDVRSSIGRFWSPTCAPSSMPRPRVKNSRLTALTRASPPKWPGAGALSFESAREPGGATRHALHSPSSSAPGSPPRRAPSLSFATGTETPARWKSKEPCGTFTGPPASGSRTSSRLIYRSISRLFPPRFSVAPIKFPSPFPRFPGYLARPDFLQNSPRLKPTSLTW